MLEIPQDQIWMVVVSFLVAFVLAFGIGANDVANSFGTSVGARVLTLKQACILASIFETLGAILLGAKVSDTIRKGIIDIEPYKNNTAVLMMGNVAALSGSCVWLIGATLLRLPVSATHSIVGATVGFALVAHGVNGINWTKFATIIGSWFISPVLAGGVSTFLFYVCKFFILSKPDPLEPGLRFLPLFYASTIVINVFSVFYDGPEMLYFDRIPLWGTFVIAFGSGIISAVSVRLILVPWQRRRIKEQCSYNPPTGERTDADQVKFTFAENSAVYSANNSRKNSLEKPAIAPEDVIEPADINLEQAENAKNISALNNLTFIQVPAENENLGNPVIHTDAANYVPPKVVSNGAILQPTEVAKLSTSPPKDKNLLQKPGYDKAEDAPLMDNEYRLGSTTPMRSPTAEDLQGLEARAAGDPVKLEAGTEVAENGKPEESQDGRSMVTDRPETAKVFSFLQILTAIFGAFAHGGNDVSNAIGPLVSLWLIAYTGVVSAKASTPIWILFYGGAGISIGLWCWGRRVIKTIGEDLTKVTPSSGFCIEIGSALTVLVASNVGIPISTTHCKVGSVVFVGRFRARENVDWSIFRNIVLAWLVTLPVAGGISAAIMAVMLKLVIQ